MKEKEEEKEEEKEREEEKQEEMQEKKEKKKNDNIKLIVPMGVNAFLGIINRLLQIIYYCLNRYKKSNKYGFKEEELRKAALTFCIFPTGVNIFMMSLYCIFHYEEKMTPIIKIKNFFRYILSIEVLFPLGVHKSLKTKYSYNADTPIITLRLVNAVHFMFVALPQLLIVPINSSMLEEGFHGVDIASLVFSCLFMIWSVGYYFICIMFKDDYEDYICEYAEKNDNDKLE